MGHDDFERLAERGKLSEQEKSLASTAKNHGVGNYAFFKGKGYRGMYNMGMSQLKRFKKFLSKGGHSDRQEENAERKEVDDIYVRDDCD